MRLYVPGQEHKAAFRAAFKSIRSAAKISETALGGDGSAEPPAPTSQGLPAEYLWPAVGVGIVLFVVAMSLVLLCVKKCKSGSSKPVIPNIDLSALPSPFQSATSAPAMPKLRTEGDTLKKTLPSLFSSKDSAGLPPPPSYN